MPLTIRVHHTVCYRYHVEQFVEKVQGLVANCEEWVIPWENQ